MADFFNANSIGSYNGATASGIARSASPAPAAPPAGVSSGDAVSSLHAGDTIQAQVVDRQGSDITLKLPGDQILQAKIQQSIPSPVGTTMSFQVRSNSGTLSLSPLYTNTASEPTAIRALNMAGLPSSAPAVSMTSYMMQAGLSIDRSSLLQMFSSVNAHPNAPITDIVDLTRLGLPVNDTNLQQLSDYKNLSYELGSGMQEVADSVRQTLMDLISNGDVTRAGALMEGLTQMALGGEIPEELSLLRPEQLSDQQMTGEKLPDGFADGALPAQVSQAEGQSASVDAAGRMVSQPSADSNANGAGPLSVSDLPVSSDTNGSSAAESAAGSAAAPDALHAQAPGSAAERALLLLRGLQAQEASEEAPNASAQGLSAKGNEVPSIVPDPALPGNGAPDGIQANPDAPASPLSQAGLPEQLPAEMRQVADLLTSLGAETNLDNASPAQLLQTLSGTIHTLLAKGDHANLHKLLQSPDVRDLTLDLLKSQWTITPSEVSDKEKIQNLYHRLNTQLEQLTQTLEKQDLTNTSAFQNSSNMHQNLDFLQQINQMYAYVQLPIRLSQGDTAHGDLYVYTNGKKLTGNESTVSALLHLDMEHLGPLDVYVALDRSGIEQKVSTQFYVQDDEILDFLDAHMDELVKHLQSRGYPCSCKMHIRGEQEAEGNAETLPDQSGVNFLLVSQAHIRGGDISFDVRT